MSFNIKKPVLVILSVVMLITFCSCSSQELTATSTDSGVSEFVKDFAVSEFSADENTAEQNIRNVGGDTFGDKVSVFKFSDSGDTYLYYQNKVYLLCKGEFGLISSCLCNVDGHPLNEFVYTVSQGKGESAKHLVYAFSFVTFKSEVVYENQSYDLYVCTDKEGSDKILPFVKVYSIKNIEGNNTDFTYKQKKLLGTVSSTDGNPDFKKHSGSAFD